MNKKWLQAGSCVFIIVIILLYFFVFRHDADPGRNEINPHATEMMDPFPPDGDEGAAPPVQRPEIPADAMNISRQTPAMPFHPQPVHRPDAPPADISPPEQGQEPMPVDDDNDPGLIPDQPPEPADNMDEVPPADEPYPE